MDQHKIKVFIKENPNTEFPRFDSVLGPYLENLKSKVAIEFNTRYGLKIDAFLDKIKNVGFGKILADAESESFNFRSFLTELGIVCSGSIYINWYRFDRVDSMQLSDFCEYFEYIWYPGVDDIEVFDLALTWMVSISHGGQVALVIKDNKLLV